ncbi:ketoacyl-synt-domain-containing protein [Hypoxylon cercidicola]|nr:ketoacyl-synt-domain-containing protein [Hypoxylon cercidicola]
MDGLGPDAVDPIAVVGMGCRFPGTATSPSRLWQMLCNGESAWSEIPKDRMDISSYFHPSGNRQGSIPFRAAHFLQEDVGAFDTSFFSIPADEAKAIDPQQRMLLEVSVETLDNAGIDRNAIRQTETGVWVGSFVKDYEQIVLRDPDDSPKYVATGNGIAIMSNRISFFLDIHGPSMTIDTGCSASLVCVHNACQALRDGEIDTALAGGTGLILMPTTMMPMTALNFLSPDGKCYSFDARANGYGRGEGVGIVVLKRLKDAIRDNDNIRAVIRGSRVNQDGRTPGITLPSAEAQLRNISTVYKRAGLSVDKTAYVECHGTGTQAGDWRELKAISDALCAERDPAEPIYVGSVKANIGHLEGCAGIAGLIKGILAIENGMIPKQLNFEAPGNPAIDFQGWKVKVPTQNTPWPVKGLRRASVNCFGFGGTNAHVILDDAAHYLAKRGLLAHHNSTVVDAVSDPPTRPLMETRRSVTPIHGIQAPIRDSQTHLFVFSAHEQKVLSRMIQEYKTHVEQRIESASDGVMENLAYTLGCRRTKLPWRAAVVARSPEDLILKLTELQPKAFVRGLEDNPTKVAFVFGGQGAQWFAMGRELLGFDIFLQSIMQATSYLESHTGCPFNLLEELLRDQDSSRIDQPEISQPATTAIQVALVDLLMQYLGISPNSVCGHSSGEIAAAYALGALSREHAWELAFHRGRCASALQASEDIENPKGGMLVVGVSPSGVQKYVDRLGNDRVAVACITSPVCVTLSGDMKEIQELQATFQAEGIFNRLLVVGVAYHSHHMRRCEATYLESIAHIMPRKPIRKVIPHPHSQGRLVTLDEVCSAAEFADYDSSSETPIMFSSVTGKAIGYEELCPAYWLRNMVSPVLFADAMHQMVKGDEKPSMIIELSPHSSLQGPVQQILDAEKLKQRPSYISVLRRHKNAAVTLLEAVGKIWVHGCNVAMPWAIMRNVQVEQPKLLVDLPKYPWNHDNVYWHESHLSRANRFQVHGRYDLVGRPTIDSTPFQPRWRGFFRLSENPWIQDHQVQNTIIYPAAGMITMVFEAAKQLASENFSGIEITQFRIHKAMIIPPTLRGLEYALNLNTQTDRASAQSVESSLPSASSTRFQFSIYSKPLDKPWEEHCTGFVAIHYHPPAEGPRTEHHVLRERLSRTEERFQTYFDAKNSSDESVIPRQLYETLDVIGMNYGPLFRNICSLQKRDNTCVSVIRIPDTKSVMPANFEYSHTIHPATLDSIFQTAFAISSEPMVPSFIGGIYVSAESHALSESGKQLVAYTRADRRGRSDASASFTVSDDSWLGSSGPRRSPLLIIKDMIFTALAPTPINIPNAFLPNHRNLCSEIIWEKLDFSLHGRQEAVEDDGDQLDLPNRFLVLVPADISPSIDRLREEFAKRLDCQFRTLDSIDKNERLPEFCISLLEADGRALVWDWTEQGFLAFRAVITATKRIFWITRGSQLEATNPQSCLVHALGRTIHSEYPNKRLVSFDVDFDTVFSSTSAGLYTELFLDVIKRSFFEPQATKPVETEYTERDGQIMVPRLVPIKSLSSKIERGSAPETPELQLMPLAVERPLKLEMGDIDDVRSLHWIDDLDARLPLSPDDVKVRVITSMLSDLDNDIVHGRVRNDSLGTDVYGVVEQTGKNVTNLTVGDNVVGIARGSLRDYVKCHNRLLYKSADLEFQPGRPYLPTSFSVAKYALGNVNAGDTVLIHAGESLSGQTAIQLAISAGATVFASAKTNNQRGVLHHFWKLPEDHILDETPDTLVETVLRLTDDKGVDVIYDPVARSRDVNILCIRQGGRIISFANKPDTNGATVHRAEQMNKTFSCTVMDVPLLIKYQPQRLGDALAYVCPRIASGTFKVWHSGHPQLYDYADLVDAFKALDVDSAGTQISCQRPESKMVPILPRPPRSVRDHLRGDATYVLSGGLGGLGIEVAKLLAANGAKNIVFLTRSGRKSELAKSCLDLFHHRKINVRVYKADISNREALEKVSSEMQRRMPPVKGVFQCAAVLRDSVFDNMTYEDWELATRPKTMGSWNLYQVFGNGLDFLIFLSSSAGVVGNRAQANYAAGNAFQDSLAQHISAAGKSITHAVSLDLGPILGAGMLAEDPQTLDKLKASGFFGIRLQDFKRIVESAITGYTEGDEKIPAQVVTGVGTGGLTRQNKPADPYWTRTALFTHLNRVDMPESPETDSEGVAESRDMMKILLAQAADANEARCIVSKGLREMLSKSMNMDPSDVDESRPPSNYGVDSLVAVGVRNWVSRECEADVSIFEVLSETSIGELSVTIVERRGKLE